MLLKAPPLPVSRHCRGRGRAVAQNMAEIVSALKEAEKLLDEIDGLPFGTVGKTLDKIMSHVQTALHEAENEAA